MRNSFVRQFLLPLALTGTLASQQPAGTPRIVQGPMVGAVDAESVSIWMRVSAPVDASVVYGKHPNLHGARESERVRATRESDRCAVVVVDGLEPGTRYHWAVRIDGRPDKYLGDRGPFEFTTAPSGAARTRVAFGSCARVQADPVQPIWARVGERSPDVFLWIGDNVYGDTDDPDVLAEEYRRQRNVPALQQLLRSTPQLAVWDDHDYGLNDHDRTSPMREAALAVFRRYWANPSYGLPDAPGVFFRWSYGGVDWFFLDVRSYRDPNREPDGPAKSMLGVKQLEWLRNGLRASSAPFKLLVSGSGWSKAKGPGGDSWASYLDERDRLFDWIARERIAGVVLVSGDTHVAELNCIPWSERGGYDFYDLVSSPLAQLPGTSWLDRKPELRIRPVHAAGPNFGLIDIDTTAADPTLRFVVVTSEGTDAWEPLVLRASDLVPGVRSSDRARDRPRGR